jgi:hypothetical protein
MTLICYPSTFMTSLNKESNASTINRDDEMEVARDKGYSREERDPRIRGSSSTYVPYRESQR